MAISGDTAIISSPNDGDMCFNSSSVYIFIRRDNGTWEKVHKITAGDGEASDYFG